MSDDLSGAERQLAPDDRKVIDDIAEYGWHVVGIAAEGTSPAWAFTIGLYESFEHPEVLIMGLPVETLMAMANVIGEQVKSGARFAPGVRYGDILDGFDCQFEPVDESLYADYVGYALWYYKRQPFPLLQCLWPDKENRLPGDPGFIERLGDLQRLEPIEWAEVEPSASRIDDLP
jgi:hypothetical protein